jgi:hypothetical protein
MDINTVIRLARCNLWEFIGEPMRNIHRSITTGPRRKTNGRDITWLSSNMIQSKVPTHWAMSSRLKLESSGMSKGYRCAKNSQIVNGFAALRKGDAQTGFSRQLTP